MNAMTEEEAKKKWCPKYQVAVGSGDPTSPYQMDNRPQEYEQKPGDPKGMWRPTGRLEPVACCIGSACMAWRHQGFTSTGDEKLPIGVCGLAGQP